MSKKLLTLVLCIWLCLISVPSFPKGTSAGNYPTLLSSYTLRPSFPVAGVDYRVGVPPGTVLTDAATASLPANVTRSIINATWTVTGATTIDSIDFSTNGGWTIIINSAVNNVIIQNCYFKSGSNQNYPYPNNNIISALFAGTVSFLHNTWDGDGLNRAELVSILPPGPRPAMIAPPAIFTAQYNLFKNITQDVFQLSTDNVIAGGSLAAPTVTNNMFYNNAYSFTEHTNIFQTSFGVNSMTFQYNTWYVESATANVTPPINGYPGQGGSLLRTSDNNGYSILNVEASYNTIILIGATGHVREGGEITAVADNGSGAMRVTTNQSGMALNTGDSMTIFGAQGVPGINGVWTITRISNAPFTADLQSSSFSGSYTGNGSFRSYNASGTTWVWDFAFSVPAAWQANHAYGTGDFTTVTNDGGKSYVAVQAGNCTSAASGGPTGTGSGIADNTCQWSYIVTNPQARNHRAHDNYLSAINAISNTFLSANGSELTAPEFFNTFEMSTGHYLVSDNSGPVADATYSAGTSYNTGKMVKYTDGKLYASLENGNVGNTPSCSVPPCTHWQAAAAIITSVITSGSTAVLTGTAVPNVDVIIMLATDGVYQGLTTADVNGNWTFTTGSLASGTYNFNVRATVRIPSSNDEYNTGESSNVMGTTI